MENTMNIINRIFIKKLMSFYLLSFIFLTTPFIASAQDLFSNEDLNYLSIPQATNVINQRAIKINQNLFIKLIESEKSMPKNLTIELFDGKTIKALLDNVSNASKDSISWIGHVKGNINDQIVLTINKNAKIMMGTIRSNGQDYKIEFNSQVSGSTDNTKTIHVLKQLDANKRPKDHPLEFPNGVLNQINNSIEAQANNILSDDGSVIDIMVVYTPSAKNAVGGTAAMNTLIDLAVTETNIGYSASGINPTVNLAHKQEVTFTETTFSDALNKLRLTSDGHMDNVHTLRDTHHADLVSLIINNSSSCGLGYVNSSASSAFTVVHHGCATGYYSFAHEFGHNQGALHDWRVDQHNSHKHGYVNTANSWRTIMAYNDTANCSGGSCTRQNFWSNPNKTYNGDPTGVPVGSYHPADNRKTLNDSALTVANFRSSTPPTGDSFEPDNTSANASLIANENIQNHSLHIGSDTDWVTFTLSSSTDIALETSGVSGDTLIDLYNSASALITTDDDGGSGTFSKISQNLAAGVYFARVREYGGNDPITSYQLLLSYARPAITAPVTGSTLSGSSETFSLTSNGVPLTHWYLRVGSIVGANDIANQFTAGASNSITINGLPTDSSTVYVRLMYKEAGVWKLAANYTYTASAVATSPVITSPISGSTLSGSSETFSLDSNGVPLTHWYFRVGSTVGANDIANQFTAGASNSITINGLPTDSSTVYVRLMYKEAGVWKLAANYTYTASAVATSPVITSPISGSTLSGSSETFSLDSNGVPLTHWYFRVGSTVGANDIANQFTSGTSTSITINGLPTDSSTVYVRLMYKEAGIWKLAANYTYTASAVATSPVITSPTSGSTLSGSSETFSLDSNGVPLTHWYLRVGSTIGANDIANQFTAGTSNSITINGLPTDSSTVYVRLMYKEAGVWKLAANYSYTASN